MRLWIIFDLLTRCGKVPRWVFCLPHVQKPSICYRALQFSGFFLFLRICGRNHSILGQEVTGNHLHQFRNSFSVDQIVKLRSNWSHLRAFSWVFGNNSRKNLYWENRIDVTNESQYPLLYTFDAIFTAKKPSRPFQCQPIRFRRPETTNQLSIIHYENIN